MVISKDEIISMLGKFKRAFSNDSDIGMSCDSLSAALLPRNVAYEFECESINFFTSSIKDDFFIRCLKYHVKNDPIFPYSDVLNISYSSENKTLKFLLLDNSFITKKASDVTFDLNANGEDLFTFLL